MFLGIFGIYMALTSSHRSFLASLMFRISVIQVILKTNGGGRSCRDAPPQIYLLSIKGFAKFERSKSTFNHHFMLHVSNSHPFVGTERKVFRSENTDFGQKNFYYAIKWIRETTHTMKQDKIL